jgi:hypothetical protein
LRIPDDILERFEEKTEGLQFGAVTLTVFFNPKTGKPRFVINQEMSLLSDYDDEDEGGHNKTHGRTHIDAKQVEKAKEFMRSKQPDGVRIIDIAEAIGCSQSKALRILDLFSKGTDFLVYMDDEKRPARYYISKDVP